MSRGQVIVLGINGHVGHHIAKAFVAGGWEVSGMGRSNRQPVEGVRFVKGDADSIDDLRAAIGSIEVVVNALNLPYDKWGNGAMEAQNARVIEALGTSGKTLLFPGNVYNYAAADRILTPDLPQRPETPRGEIRQRTEALYRAAASKGHIQAIILRAGDFFGPESQGDWFDLVMLREAAKGKFAMMGARGVAHAWAYLPDLARAFEKLAWHRKELASFENFHFHGTFVTPEVLADAVVAAAPVKLKVSMFPRILLGAMGLFEPVMREIAKMGYLWENAMELKDPRLDAILGPDFTTPFSTAVAETVRPFFAEKKLAA